MRLLGLVLLCALPAAAEVQAELTAAIAARQPVFRLPAGELRLPQGLVVNGARDLVIDGSGTTLVIGNSDSAALTISGCRGLTLTGLTVDYDPLPFTQGSITACDLAAGVFDFEVHAGYPSLTPDYCVGQVHLFEPDQRRWRREAPDYYPRRVEAAGERAGRLVFNPRTPQLDLIRLGDRIVLNKRTNSTIKIYDGEDISIRGVTLLAGPGVGVIARYLRGDNRFTLDIRPGPTPPGATQPRLMSTCADGLNYAYADRGPRIENCRFSFMGDDSINLHGTVMPVVACPTPTELLVAWPYGPESLAKVLLPGGRARRLQAPNFAIAGEAVITGFAREPALTEQATRRLAEVWPRNPAGRGTLWRLTLATPLPFLPGEFVDFPETAAPGYRIAGCTFEDHRGHALRIMASRGVIEQNVMRRIKYAGVAIGAEYGFWREAGWVDEVVIRGNRIEDVTLSPRLREPQSLNLGAISVYARPERFGPDLTLFAGHRRIVIEDNVIDGSALAGIHVVAAREVTIRNNVLKRTNYATAPDAGRETGQRLTGPIETSGVPDAVVENNLIQELGQAYRE